MLFNLSSKLKLVYQVNSCKINNTLNLFNEIKIMYILFLFEVKKTYYDNISFLYSYYFLTKVLSKSLMMLVVYSKYIKFICSKLYAVISYRTIELFAIFNFTVCTSSEISNMVFTQQCFLNCLCWFSLP